MKAKFRDCFSQVQQVNIKIKIMCTSPGYLSIYLHFFNTITQANYREFFFAVKLKKKNIYIYGIFLKKQSYHKEGLLPMELTYLIFFIANLGEREGGECSAWRPHQHLYGG